MTDQTNAESDQIDAKLSEIVVLYEKDRSQLIPILQKVQETFGYLPKQAILAVGFYLEMTDAQIYGVASFYNHFRFTPAWEKPDPDVYGDCLPYGGRWSGPAEFGKGSGH